MLSDRFPKTLDDIHLDYTEKQRREGRGRWRITILHFPVGITNSDFFANIGTRPQFHPDLPEPTLDPNLELHDVYVVCSPHIAWSGSYKHWSIYTQGHFYHLTIEECLSCLVEAAASTSESTGKRSKTVLNHQDMSSENTPDYVSFSSKRRKLALIAYQVGKTCYKHQEIYTLANWLIGRMPFYSRLDDNCQRFALSLMNRTIMTKRDFATFVGDGIQLVNWDSTRGTTTPDSGSGHRNCIQNGYQIFRGDTKVPRLLSYRWIAEPANHLIGATNVSLAVSKLYKKGFRAPGAYVPNANTNRVQYFLRYTSEEFQKDGRLRSVPLRSFMRTLEIENGRTRSGVEKRR